MTEIVITPPETITITATSPTAYTITVTQPAAVTVTASVGNVGDMTKAVYDTDNDGVVDDADALGGVPAGSYALSSTVPALVTPSVADNFVSFSNITGTQKDSGKGLTHLVYTIQTVPGGAISPADGSTYYFGGDGGASTGANIRRVYFPFTGTLVYAQVNIQVLGNLGDAATFSAFIRINNTTDLTITTSAAATAVFQQYQATLSQAVTGGTTYFEGKVTFPTWPTTNPTTVKCYFILGVQV